MDDFLQTWDQSDLMSESLIFIVVDMLLQT